MKKVIYLWVLLTTIVLGGCQVRALNPQSETAKGQSFLIYFSFGMMMLVLLTVFFLLFLFVRKYREKKVSHEVPEQVAGNKRLELTWTIIPILLLAILAVPTVIITYNQSPNKTMEAEADEDEVHVQVTARRYEWEFTYRSGKKIKDDLYLPSNKKIVLHLQSEDVIHSFWAPSIGGKVDALPNKENTIVFRNIKEVTYKGKCAEFCGTNHAKMRFTTNVLPTDEYEKWLKQ